MRDWAAFGVLGVILSVAILRALGSKPPHDARPLPEPVAHQVYLETTDREADERREGAFRFQGSLWSQEDDFFAKETSFIKELANQDRVSIGSILFALDEGMREKWPTHPGVVITPKVVPCRPRLAYH